MGSIGTPRHLSQPRSSCTSRGTAQDVPSILCPEVVVPQASGPGQAGPSSATTSHGQCGPLTCSGWQLCLRHTLYLRILQPPFCLQRAPGSRQVLDSVSYPLHLEHAVPSARLTHIPSGSLDITSSTPSLWHFRLHAAPGSSPSSSQLCQQSELLHTHTHTHPLHPPPHL